MNKILVFGFCLSIFLSSFSFVMAETRYFSISQNQEDVFEINLKMEKRFLET